MKTTTDDPASGETALVRSTTAAGIVTVTLESRPNRNALSRTLVEQLLDSLSAASSDPNVHAVVLTAAGSVFCSGADLSDPPSNDPSNPHAFPHVLRAIRACPKPVIARINGHVRAGGIGMVAACDIAVAINGATFAFSEVRIGVVPAIISVVCQPVMQPRAFARYALTGEVFDATAAEAAGLLTLAVEPNALDDTVDAMLADLRRSEPKAVTRTKTLLREIVALSVDDALPFAARLSAEMFESPEAREGIAAFREKRSPSWAW